MDDVIELNHRIDEISHSDSDGIDDELSLLPSDHNQSNPWLSNDDSIQVFFFFFIMRRII